MVLVQLFLLPVPFVIDFLANTYNMIFNCDITHVLWIFNCMTMCYLLLNAASGAHGYVTPNEDVSKYMFEKDVCLDMEFYYPPLQQRVAFVVNLSVSES